MPLYALTEEEFAWVEVRRDEAKATFVRGEFARLVHRVVFGLLPAQRVRLSSIGWAYIREAWSDSVLGTRLPGAEAIWFAGAPFESSSAVVYVEGAYGDYEVALYRGHDVARFDFRGPIKEAADTWRASASAPDRYARDVGV